MALSSTTTAAMACLASATTPTFSPPLWVRNDSIHLDFLVWYARVCLTHRIGPLIDGSSGLQQSPR
eukprot:m.118482 g.118482  ORF g.118482 m.118482 type:complete len:66 (-) comp52016_c0_seq1:1298-1495(-)